MIYIDPLLEAPSSNFRAFRAGLPQSHKWCHLYTFPVSDEALRELHELAESIGLRREWFQNTGVSLPHYDLVPSKRSQTLKTGKVTEATKQETSSHNRAYRKEKKAAREQE